MSTVTTGPIFIHSLFRAGSTYLFHVFRRSDSGYWCYQEPLHEISLYAQNDHDLLLTERGEKMVMLRHPGLELPYFMELYEVADQCLGKLKKSEIYDAYFAPASSEQGIGFWKSLIETAQGQPVIQECRTASRIGSIKSALNGFHVYLWRNPWDQWWSYKVADYFDATSLLFINAEKPPEVIYRLRREIGFEGLNEDDLRAQIEWFISKRLPPEQTYLVFYVLWCLGLREGLKSADMLLNIDRLSNSPEYRAEAMATLSFRGFEGIDFSDCSIPQTQYGAQDRAFFLPIEDKAHGLFLLSGWTQQDLNELLTIRRINEPISWGGEATPIESDGRLRDGERARSLALSAEKCTFQIRSAFSAELNMQEQRAVAAEARSSEQEQRAVAAEARSSEQERRAVAAEIRASEQEQSTRELEANSHHWWQQACGLESERNALRQSWSWRITAPGRFVGDLAVYGGPSFRSFANRTAHFCINALQRPLAAMMRTVFRHPGLRYRLSQCLLRYPALYQQLLGVARNEGVIPGLSAHLAQSPYSRIPEDKILDHLTPHARQIYQDLKMAIELRQKKED